MKNLSTIFFIISSTFYSYGQSVNYNFEGIITTSDKQTMTFKIVINELKKDGLFNGYSITNYKESKDYTKTAIEGIFDVNHKKMSFQEKGNIETTSSAQNSTFCYIKAKNLIIDIQATQNIIKGNFEGVFPSGKICATGSIFLINKDKLQIPTSITKPNIPKPITDSVMTSNDELVIDNWNENLLLEIWDANIEDNDAVSIYLNNQLLKEKIILKNEKTIVQLPAQKNQFQLKIVALNEGDKGVNTLNFHLKEVKGRNHYMSKLKTGESFTIIFKKK